MINEKHNHMLLMYHLIQSCPLSEVVGIQDIKCTVTALLSVTDNWMNTWDSSEEVSQFSLISERLLILFPHRSRLENAGWMEMKLGEKPYMQKKAKGGSGW